jgi:hypothetical protein
MRTVTQNLYSVSLHLLLILLGTAYVTTAVSADTITLVSGGGGAVGTADPITDVSINGGATYQDAIIISPNVFYDVIPGTQWISFNSSGNGLEFTSMLFRVTFQLPAGYSNPQLSLLVHADNVATGVLNGVEFGGQPFVNDVPNFQDPPETISTANPALFQVGQNVLTIKLFNFNDPSGLDYQATITFDQVPEPTTAVLVGASLFVGLLLRKKRSMFP